MAVGTSTNSRSARKSAANKTGKIQRRSSAALIDPDRRRALVAEAAYFRAESRGFEPGHEAEDWLAAELEIDRALAISVSPSINPAVQ